MRYQDPPGPGETGDPADLALAEGVHHLRATVEDVAGNVGEETAEFRVDVTLVVLSQGPEGAMGVVGPLTDGLHGRTHGGVHGASERQLHERRTGSGKSRRPVRVSCGGLPSRGRAVFIGAAAMARPLCLSLLLGAALATSACDLVEDLNNRFKTCQDATVVLLNSEQTLGPVHITGPGEGFAADNLLDSGFSRRIQLCLERGDRKMFRAGVNSDVIGTATCVAERARYEGVVPRVVWGPGGFTCQGW